MFEYPGIDQKILIQAKEAETALSLRYKKIDVLCEENMYKVISAFERNHVSETHFSEASGYGYNDAGRDVTEAVFADIFHAEDALVRPQITCGTQAIYLSMHANLLPEDEILFASGMPYDSLFSSIGITDAPGSLKESGIDYKIANLKEDSSFDKDGIRQLINEKTKMVHIQRSRGYSLRHSFSVEEIGDIISYIREIKSDVIINVDNCYGEFTENIEPTDAGCDMCVGSLIKNPGGGIASTGGYITGKKEYIKRCANRLTAPGLGKEVGPSLGLSRAILQGLSIAPKVTGEALKNAYFAAWMAENSGYDTYPSSDEEHYCIVQSIVLKNAENVKKYCENIQKASFIDSFVSPEAAYMPGYEDDIIMASGSFVSGSSIELSCDGPLREPYAVYLQGCMTHEQGRYAVIKAMNALLH